MKFHTIVDVLLYFLYLQIAPISISPLTRPGLATGVKLENRKKSIFQIFYFSTEMANAHIY